MSAALEPLGRRPIESDVLRELRHVEALAAREATNWLLYLEGARKSPRTRSEYTRILDGLLERHPDTPLGELSDDDCFAYVMSHPEPSRPVVKSALNGFFKWAVRKRLIVANPIDLLPDIKARDQVIVPVFSDVEAEALCGLPLPDGVLMRVLFSTGIRRAEACALQVKHVSFDRRHIEIHRGKGGSSRLVPLSPTLAGRLDHWFTTDGMDRDDFLWYSRPGGHWRDHSKRIGSTSFQRWWGHPQVGCLARAGVEYRNPHCTRHTFATRSIRNGVSIDMVRRVLGHRNIATTVQQYVHMSVDDMADSFAAVELD